MNPSIRFNSNPKSSILYTLSLGMGSAIIFYMWRNMIDFLIIITSIKYAIKVISQCKQQAWRNVEDSQEYS